MTKSILMLAVLGAFAGSSLAQSNVTLSGSADAGVRHTGTAAGSQWAVGGSASAYNSLTFSGREDLGGGMYSLFSMHHRFFIDTGAINGTSLAGGADPFWRNVFVGMGHTSYGEIRMGHNIMPLQEIDSAFDAWLNSTVATSHTSGIAATIRANRMIEYRSPKIAGFDAWAAVAGRSQLVAESGSGPLGYNPRAASINSTRPVGLVLRYENAALRIAAAYDRNGSNQKTYGLYAAYNFGVAEVLGQFEKGDNFTSPVSVPTRPDEHVKAYAISARVPIGAAVALAGVHHISSDLPNRDATKLGAGLWYYLSKRTTLYTDIGKWSGDRVSVATKKTQFDIGMRHSF